MKDVTPINNPALKNPEPRQLDPTVRISPRGRILDLHFDWKAVATIWETTGLNIMAGELTPQEFLKPVVLMAVIMAGLKRHHPAITEAEIADVLDMGNLRYWVVKIREAMAVISPDEIPELEIPEKEEGEATPPLPSTGSTTPSGA